MCLVSSRDTTMRGAMSHEGSMEGKIVSRKVQQREFEKSELPCSRHGLTNANRMPRKRDYSD